MILPKDRDLCFSHAVLGFQHQEYLRLYPEHAIAVSQSIRMRSKSFREGEIPGWSWHPMESGKMGQLFWFFLQSSSFSWLEIEGQHLLKSVFVWKPAGAGLAEQPLSLLSLLEIPCRRAHQGPWEESGMAPHCQLQVLDHLVAAFGVSRINKVKDRGFRKVHI